MKKGYLSSSDYPYLGVQQYHINTKNTFKSLSININHYYVKPSKMTVQGRERPPTHFFETGLPFLRVLRSTILFVDYPGQDYPMGSGSPSCWDRKNQETPDFLLFQFFFEFIKYHYFELLSEGSTYECSFLKDFNSPSHIIEF